MVLGMLSIRNATAWWLGYGRRQIYQTVAGFAKPARGHIPVSWANQTHAIKTNRPNGRFLIVFLIHVSADNIFIKKLQPSTGQHQHSVNAQVFQEF